MQRRHRHPIADLFDLLGRRWTLRVLWELRSGHPLSYSALRAACGEMSTSVLSQRLAELVEAELVTHGEKGYALTRRGRELLEHLGPLNEWAKRWARPKRKP